MPLLTPLGIIDSAISLLGLIVFLGVILSWLPALGIRINHYNPVVRFLEQATEAVTSPIRRVMPVAAGGMDFSPMIVLILLAILRQIVHQML